MDVNDHDFVLWPTFFFLIFFFKSNRCYNFWTTRDRAFLISHVHSLWWGLPDRAKIFILWSLPWPLTYISKDFYIGHNFCTVQKKM